MNSKISNVASSVIVGLFVSGSSQIADVLSPKKVADDCREGMIIAAETVNNDQGNVPGVSVVSWYFIPSNSK